MSTKSTETTDAVDTASDETKQSSNNDSASFLTSTTIYTNTVHAEQYKKAIPKCRRNLDEAASSNSLRVAMVSGQNAVSAAITNLKPATREHLVSNTCAATHISDSTRNNATNEGDTSTNVLSANRDKSSSREGDEDVTKRIDTVNTEEDVNMGKMEHGGKSKELRFVSQESSYHSAFQSISSHDALQLASTTILVNEAPNACHAQEKPDARGRLDGYKIDDDARVAVDTLLGLHDFSLSHIKTTPSVAAFSSLAAISRVGSGSKKRELILDIDGALVKKRRYQKRDSDRNTTDGKKMLEKKRLASRISSKRTREREKMRGEYFRTIRKKLEKKNRKLVVENNHIRSLINKTKKEIARNKFTPPSMRSATSLQSSPSLQLSQIPSLSTGQGTAGAMFGAGGVPLPNLLQGQGQEQFILFMLQQLVGQGNSGANHAISQQNLPFNPAMLALLVAGLQNGKQSQAPIEQQLLPIVLASQLNGGGSPQEYIQQALTQLLPMLLFCAAQNQQQQQQSLQPLLANLLQASSVQNDPQATRNAVVPSSQLSSLLSSQVSANVPSESSEVSSSSSSASVPLPSNGLPRAPLVPAPAPSQMTLLGGQQVISVATETNSLEPSSSPNGQALLSQLQLHQLATMMNVQGQQVSPQMEHKLMASLAMHGSDTCKQHPRPSAVEEGQSTTMQVSPGLQLPNQTSRPAPNYTSPIVPTKSNLDGSSDFSSSMSALQMLLAGSQNFPSPPIDINCLSVQPQTTLQLQQLLQLAAVMSVAGGNNPQQ
jgi:hypothetical protein